MDTIILKKGKEKPLFHKHPWVFSGAIASKTGTIKPGSIVRVLSSDEQFLGVGYYNPASNIAVRILSFQEVPIDKVFFVRRLKELKAFKESFIGKTSNAYRVVFAESDGLPGLIVDKYDDVLVIQAHTLGIDTLKSVILSALIEVYKPRAVVERSDLSVRKHEGLKDGPVGVIFGELTEPVTIKEHGMTFTVDLLTGQKTGFFLDQRDNRQAIAKYAKGKTCLNLFSYTGGFSVALMKQDAISCVNVDASEPALELAKENHTQNDLTLSDESFLKVDAFEYLRLAAQDKQTFDLIVLDPPAFAKSIHDTENALRAYTKLHSAALKLLPVGGILATSSCSGSVGEADFLEAIAYAATREHATLRLVEKRGQPIDHGVNLAFPEGAYLKFLIFTREA